MRTVFGKKNKRAVSPVIGTILMVAITVVLAAVLYVMVAGLGPGQQNIAPTAVLSGGGSWRTSGNQTIYTFTVSTLNPTSANIDPTQLQYIVSNTAQTAAYTGAANQSRTYQTFTINVLYQDSLDPNKVSAGDTIQITVTPVASNPLVGGSLKVNYNSNQFCVGTM